MTVTINGTTGIANDGGYTGDGVVFADTTPANTLVTTTGGNVGIGTSSTGASRLAVLGTQSTTLGSTAQFVVSGGQGFYLNSETGNINRIAVGTGEAIALNTGSTERARIDSSGNLLVGTTSALDGGIYKLQIRHDGARAIVTETTGTTSSFAAVFRNGNGTVGNINTNGSTTSYVTSSDYRLKENIQPMTGALAKVAALKPCTYKWKADGSVGEGFIAHELQEVVPDCVTGEKDAVDAEGNPQYQGIDTSFLVATLTAAIQEQQALIASQSEIINAQQAALTALTARVTALDTRLTSLEGTQP